MKHSIKESILINVLTRTSNRPIGFKKCYTSVKEQTYKNIRHIVSYDDTKDLWYLEDLDIDLVDVTEIKKVKSIEEADAEGNLYAPYNLYCNAMLGQVEKGWVLFLDDDDNLYHNKVIEEIVSKIQANDNEDTIFVWQMRYPDGGLLPTIKQISNQIIKKNNIGSPCYLFHSKFIKDANWDTFKASDFRFLQQLLEHISTRVFLQKVMVQINNYGDLGQKNDLVKPTASNYKMPTLFYKNTLWSLIPKYHTRLFGRFVFHKNTYHRFLMKIFDKSKNVFK